MNSENINLTNQLLESLTPEMKKLINTYNFLKSNSHITLWEMLIKDIQEYILKYFKTNRIKETNNNIVSYDFPYDFASYKYTHELTENISKIIEKSYIPYGYCMSGLRKEGEYLHLLNSIAFLEILEKEISYPPITVSLSFSEYLHEHDFIITTLELEFNLKEDVQYESGKNKMIDFLLNKRRERTRLAALYTPKEYNFDDVCKTVRNKHLRVQNRKNYSSEEISDIYEFSEQLDLYDVYALLQIQGLFKYKTKIVKYPYVKYYGMKSVDSYEFTKDECSQLSRLIGVKNVELVFIYTRYTIYIVFDENHKLDISHIDIETCNRFLVKNRERTHKYILDSVVKNKEKILDHCLHVLKCEKHSPSENILCKSRDIPLLCDDDKYPENVLVIDPVIITIDLQNKVNNILGLQGFTLVAYSDIYNEDIEEVKEDIYSYGIYMKFPSHFIKM